MGRQRTWSDEDLREAVTGATSFSDVARRLGLSVCGDTFQRIKARLVALGFDLQVIEQQQARAAALQARDGRRKSRRSWTDQQLREAAAVSESTSEVLLRLGLPRSGGSFAAIRQRLQELGIPPPTIRAHTAEETPDGTGHCARVGPHRQWSDADLARAVAASRSIAGVVRQLGLQIGGGTYVLVRRRIDELGLDTTHFTGKGWRKGATAPVPGTRRPLEDILIKDSRYQSTAGLRRRLIGEGHREARCERCGHDRWNGQAIPLQLDHINGDRRDHRLENLRILCPNCHAQTDTWCGKNRGRYG